MQILFHGNLKKRHLSRCIKLRWRVSVILIILVNHHLEKNSSRRGFQSE